MNFILFLKWADSLNCSLDFDSSKFLNFHQRREEWKFRVINRSGYSILLFLFLCSKFEGRKNFSNFRILISFKKVLKTKEYEASMSARIVAFVWVADWATGKHWNTCGRRVKINIMQIPYLFLCLAPAETLLFPPHSFHILSPTMEIYSLPHNFSLTLLFYSHHILPLLAKLLLAMLRRWNCAQGCDDADLDDDERRCKSSRGK